MHTKISIIRYIYQTAPSPFDALNSSSYDSDEAWVVAALCLRCNGEDEIIFVGFTYLIKVDDLKVVIIRFTHKLVYKKIHNVTSGEVTHQIPVLC